MTAPIVATYDAQRDRWRALWDLYWGGDRVRVPSASVLADATLRWSGITADGQALVPQSARRRSYLVPHPAESDAEFDTRLALASYVNLVQPIVKAYAEGCTARVRRELDALAPYTADVNRRGSDWAEFAEEGARWMALYGLLFTVCDAPCGAPPATVAQARATAWAPYAVLVHPTSVAWLRVTPDGRLVEFAYTETPYQMDAVRAGDTQLIRVRVWRADATDAAGAAVPGGWEVREGRVTLGDALGAQAMGLAVVDQGPLPPALKGEVPVVASFYDRDTSAPYPMGASVVADAADVGRTIYNALSWAGEIHRKAGFPFLAVPLAQTGGQMDAQTRIAIGPGRALGFDSSAGAPSYVQPSPDSSRELRDHCLFLFQLALRTAGLEVASDQSAQVQSGEALRIRSRDFESRAGRFARHLQRWEEAVLRLLGALAGVDTAAVAVAYPKRFTLPDLTEDLNRALALLGSPVEIGAPLKVAAVRQAADAALALTDEELDAAMAAVEDLLAGDVEEHAAGRAARLAEAAEKLARLRAVKDKLGATALALGENADDATHARGPAP